MITAVDTNVLLDVLIGDDVHGERSRTALARCEREGRVVLSDVVWSETIAAFPDRAEAVGKLSTLGMTFAAANETAATLAGQAWRAYRKAGGPRTRILPDFIVGAHASAQADRLLTRDRGFFRSYFADLTVLDPTAE